MHLPTCNAFPFKEWGAAASCFIEKGLNMSIRPRERKAGKWNIGAHLARIGCPSSCRLYQDRCATNEVFAQSATVRPTVLARWIRTIEEKEKEGRRERDRASDVMRSSLPFLALPLPRSMPSPLQYSYFYYRHEIVGWGSSRKKWANPGFCPCSVPSQGSVRSGCENQGANCDDCLPTVGGQSATFDQP